MKRMARQKTEPMRGPLSDEALEIFTRHLSVLNGATMVLDPESAGHEMYHQGQMGRYQWKVAGGRSADHQGVAFKISMDSEIYFVRDNRIDVIIRVPERDWREIDAAILADVDAVLDPNFRPVLHAMMQSYVRPHERQ